MNKALRLVSKEIQQVQAMIQLFGESISKAISSIDWDGIEQSYRLKLEFYEEFMSQFEKDCWAIDIDLLDALEEEKCKPHEIHNYVESQLEEYINFFKSDLLYSRHITLIEETYQLYRLGFYKHCTFSLFAVIENILEISFKNYNICSDKESKPKKKNSHKKDSKLYYKTKDYIKNNNDELLVDIIFFRRVFNVYKTLFTPSWLKHPEQINRNWIAHGSYNYTLINKVDILKLFQLLKALSILNYISFETDNEKVS